MEDYPRLPAPLLSARLLAVEVLLAGPETLGNDALEGDLYILRDQLRAATSAARDVPPAPHSEIQDSSETRNSHAPET
jgi:hypothetical protein